MTKKGKIFIGCGALILLPILTLIGFTVYLRNNKEFQEYSKEYDKALEDGRYFGKTTDQYGCLQFGISRMSEIKNPTINQLAVTDLFVSECLRTSKPTPDFCTNVPKVVVKDWINDQCKLIGRENEPGCHVAFDTKTTYCAGL